MVGARHIPDLRSPHFRHCITAQLLRSARREQCGAIGPITEPELIRVSRPGKVIFGHPAAHEAVVQNTQTDALAFAAWVNAGQDLFAILCRRLTSSLPVETTEVSYIAETECLGDLSDRPKRVSQLSVRFFDHSIVDDLEGRASQKQSTIAAQLGLGDTDRNRVVRGSPAATKLLVHKIQKNPNPSFSRISDGLG